MGWTIGIPSLKLNKTGTKSKHCGDFASVAAEALKERKGHDPDINPELAAKNIYEGFQTAADLMDYSDAHCSTLRDASGRPLRKDAVRMCVTIIKPPAAFMATLTEADQKQFLEDGVEKLAEIVGPDNLRSLAWHFDEQGAHVHCFWEPMTEDGRLCAKELHNLTFFNRLNREMPEHLRSKGWDIDDCNAYDAAKEELMTEKEKAERRQKNGRSSAVYKAAAQKELNEINHAIDSTLDHLDVSIQEFADRSIEAAVDNEDGIYDNALFLLTECDDERFEELDREGRDLKRERLKESLDKTPVSRDLHQLIDDARAGRKKNLTWEERQRMWDLYKVMSDHFWRARGDLMADYNVQIGDAYSRRRDALSSYYDAKCMLHRSRGLITTIIAVVWMVSAQDRAERISRDLESLRKERDDLIRNTATFKKYSNAYREDLKAGKLPAMGFVNALSSVVGDLDEEYGKVKRQNRVVQRSTKEESR